MLAVKFVSSSSSSSLLLVIALIALTTLLVDVAHSQRAVARRPEVKGALVYDDCRTFATGFDYNVSCTTANTTQLLSLTTNLISNTGLGVSYIIALNDDYIASRLPNNRRIGRKLSLNYEVSGIKLKYKMALDRRMPNRYYLQQDTGSACATTNLCEGRAMLAPVGQSCNTTQPYTNGIGGGTVRFRSPAEDFFKELNIVSNDNMYRGYAQNERLCGAASCGICEDPGGQASGRSVCDTERILWGGPVWNAFSVEPWPSIAYSIVATLTDVDTGESDSCELGVNLDLGPDGKTFLRTENRVTSFGGTFLIEVQQHTNAFPFPSVNGFVIAAEQHEWANRTCTTGKPAICTAPSRYEVNQLCEPGADAKGVYCPIFDAWEESKDLNQPQINPRPNRCEPGPRYWAFVQKGSNGWDHGTDFLQNGMLPNIYLFNNGENGQYPCYRGRGAGVLGYDFEYQSGGTARKLPPFYPEQNRQQRNSRCITQGSTGKCAEWDCVKTAPRNTPLELQGNEGYWNTWLAGGFLWAEPSVETNVFIDVRAVATGKLIQVNRVKGSGYLQSTGSDPCVLVRGRDGGLMVDVCNDSPIGADFGVDIIPQTSRYKVGVTSTTVSVKGNECVTVGPINVRLEGDIVPTGDFITVQMTDQATFSKIDELDERCTESPPPREEPLASGQSGAQGTSSCSNVFRCAAVSFNISLSQLAFLLWLMGAAILLIIIVLIVYFFGSCIVVAVAKKSL